MIRYALFASLCLATLALCSPAHSAGKVFSQKPEVVPVEIQGARKLAGTTAKKTPATKKLVFTAGPKAQWI